MPRYGHTDLGQLAHQLTLSPRRKRLEQIAGAERVLELAEPDREYPYDFVCYHLTGYRPLKPSGKPPIHGKVLVSDLVRLIEHLTRSAGLSLSSVSEPYCTQNQLAKRFNVSMKTVSRWRERGLVGWRVLDKRGVSRLVFRECALQRFVSAHRALVQRGRSFRQLTDAERTQIIQHARSLVTAERTTLANTVRQLAQTLNRPLETIRYTLRRHDRQFPDQAIFERDGSPNIPEKSREIYRLYCQGRSFKQIARRVSLPCRQIQRICLEMKAYELRAREIDCIYHPSFEAPGAHSEILEHSEVPAPPRDDRGKIRVPSDAPAYLKSLYETVLLSKEQEYDLFRRYNFCKYQAGGLISQLEPHKATQKQICQIEDYLSRADQYRSKIVKANLRLVVSIARRHHRKQCEFQEIISDGNMSLMRAVERFDFSRGFKFSTYASWVIIKNYARTIPEQRTVYTRFVTGREEILETVPGSDTVTPEVGDRALIRSAILDGMQKLTQRERTILTHHFGLHNSNQPTTLEQLGSRFKVTKERIRQIEKQALKKLKSYLSPSLADYISAD